MRCRANHSRQAWPGQAIGAVLPTRFIAKIFPGTDLIPQHHESTGGSATHPQHPARSSLPAASEPHPRSSRQSIPIAIATPRRFSPAMFLDGAHNPFSRNAPHGMAFSASESNRMARFLLRWRPAGSTPESNRPRRTTRDLPARKLTAASLLRFVF